MGDDKKWSGMKVEELRLVAKKYKAFHNLGNISKAKKADLIKTLNKFMVFKDDNLVQKPNSYPLVKSLKEPANTPSPAKPTPKETKSFFKKLLKNAKKEKASSA
jgi:hypothetical protein